MEEIELHPFDGKMVLQGQNHNLETKIAKRPEGNKGGEEQEVEKRRKMGRKRFWKEKHSIFCDR